MLLNQVPSGAGQALVIVLFGSIAFLLVSNISLLKKQGLLSYYQCLVRGIKDFVNSYRFLLSGPRIIRDGYYKNGRGPFVVRSPGTRYTLISDRELIREMDRAPREVLSLQAAAKMVKPQYTMHYFDWSDRKGFDGTPLIRSLRGLLKHNLDAVLPKTRIANSAVLDHAHIEIKQIHKLFLLRFVRTAVAETHAIAFFGDSVRHNEIFMKAAASFIDEVIIISEPLRFLPETMQRLFGPVLRRLFPSQHRMFEIVRDAAQTRIDEREQAARGVRVPEHKDVLQWVTEQSARIRPGSAEVIEPWSSERISHEMLALWFGAMHSVTATIQFAIQNIILHPEYVEPIRAELKSSAYAKFESTGVGLPLLDSFIKECSRINPIEHFSSRRKVLKPFEFSNGMRLEPGEWVCTPMGAMMHDPENWVEPEQFHGFRHVPNGAPTPLDNLNQPERFKRPEPEKALPFTDVKDWQTWGTGRMACPGRFYASAIVKQIFGLILMKYDCKLIDREGHGHAQSFTWRTSVVPNPNMPIVLEPRLERS